MREYQVYASFADGHLCFAGVRRLRKPSESQARRIVREWVEWARQYVAANVGDYPLAEDVRRLPVRPIASVELWPIGQPELTETYPIEG